MTMLRVLQGGADPSSGANDMPRTDGASSESGEGDQVAAHPVAARSKDVTEKEARRGS